MISKLEFSTPLNSEQRSDKKWMCDLHCLGCRRLTNVDSIMVIACGHGSISDILLFFLFGGIVSVVRRKCSSVYEDVNVMIISKR
jgi:hypothetical protein